MTSGTAPGRRTVILIAAVIAAVVLILTGGRLVELYIDVLWHREAGYVSAFWKRVLWGWGLRAAAALVAALVFFVNLRIVARTLGTIQIKQRLGNLEISQELPRTYVLLGALAVSAMLGLWLGATLARETGVLLLVALSSGPWGITEPVLGLDASFYVLALPLLRALVTYGLVGAFLVLSAVAAGYIATGAFRWDRKGINLGQQARRHLGLVLAAFLVLLAAQFWLGRYSLLQFGNSAVQEIFGFADSQARMPALHFLTFLSVGAAGVVVFGTWRNRLVSVAVGIGAIALGGLVVGQLYPSLVQRFRVSPNELVRETPYIEWNIDFTRLGFGLDGFDRARFEPAPRAAGGGATGVDWEAALDQFDGFPVWTANTLLTTFNQLEAYRAYYDFSTVAIDRYTNPEGAAEPVALAVREIDPNGIEDPNWQNLHIRRLYFRGLGAVVSSAAERTREGRPPMYVSGIENDFNAALDPPPQLSLEQPAVYIGASLNTQPYAILTPDEASLPGGPGTVDSAGEPLPGPPSRAIPGVDSPEGIRVGSGLRKLALAWRFQDADLLFAQEVTPESRFIFRKAVLQRVAEIAPFFQYPESPYPVVHEGRIVWVLEGFTSTRGFPLARPASFISRRVNYVRNSLKITVDAVTGDVHFYALPEDDPLLDAYRAAFPGLVKPLSEMPPGLREHLRYSKRHQALQASVLLQYHQNTAAEFHGQRAVWEFARELSQTDTPVPYEPEYGVYSLPGDDAEDFYLTTVFVPLGRGNLAAILAGRLRPDGRRELRLFDVPLEDLVPGPRQVESLIEQDPVISQQFSLWRTGGSEVWTGHLHVVPVGSHILYMEPVFLAAAADAIPQLQSFVVSDGNRVSMEPRLADAVAAISGAELEGEVAPAPEARGAELGVPTPAGVRWPREALELLDAAEERLRAGDFAGFGEALAELRTLLERIGSGG